MTQLHFMRVDLRLDLFYSWLYQWNIEKKNLNVVRATLASVIRVYYTQTNNFSLLLLFFRVSRDYLMNSYFEKSKS